MTFYPETQVLASRKDGDVFVYTVRARGRDIEVRVPLASLAALAGRRNERQARRELLGRAVREAGG